MNVFTVIGLSIAYSGLLFIGLPIITVLFGMLGGYIVQIFFGGWIINGASQLGLQLDPNHIWCVGATLAWFGTYFRFARLDSKGDK